MQEFEQQLASLWPPAHWTDVGVVVAVSGGPDSVALLRALFALAKQCTRHLVVAHYNHGWRATDADADEHFVEQLSRSLGLGYQAARAAASPQIRPATEAHARDARYRFFREVATRAGARYVVTGHTRDDQVETILHHILRGTGLAGLAGIPRVRPLGPCVTLLRPLLQLRREQILCYLQTLGQPFCQDSSNRQTKYTRNRIRHELLPQLARDYNGQVGEALLRLGSLACEAQAFIRTQADELYNSSVAQRDQISVTFELANLRAAPQFLLREMFLLTWQDLGWPLRDMSHEKWDQLAQLAVAELRAGTAKMWTPGAVCAERQGARLRLWRPQGDSP